MKILQVHNRYLSGMGGEDSVVEEEARLLRENGHDVELLSASNAEIEAASVGARLRAGLGAVWSRREYRRAQKVVEALRPDVVHVHNTFAALSPSVLWAFARAGVPVVWTLHNYRVTCATSFLLRDGRPCLDCVGRLPWPAVRHGCTYADSRALGLLIAAIQTVHGTVDTYNRTVTRFTALSTFAKDVFIEAGLRADRIVVKPNTVGDPGEPGATANRRRVVFVGLLHPAKGVDLLMDAWRSLPEGTGELCVVGDGPLEPLVRQVADQRKDVVHVGRVSRSEALDHITRGGWLVLPSRWFEGFPMVILEAFSTARPAIVPRHGPFPEFVSDGDNGVLFEPNDAVALSRALHAALAVDDTEWAALSGSARATYLRDYTPELNYERLMGIYEEARADSRKDRP